jgi:hypothetical protein
MSIGVLRQCNKCKKEFPNNSNYFYRQRLGKEGLSGTCKNCTKQIRLDNQKPIVYEIYCSVTNKYYIGQTIVPLSIRVSQHFTKAKSLKQPLYQDICRLNKDDFTYKELHVADDISDLDDLEKFYIAKYISESKDMYNLEYGGVNSFIKHESSKMLQAISKGSKPFYIFNIKGELIDEGLKVIDSDKKWKASFNSVLKRKQKLTKGMFAIYKDEYTKEVLQCYLEKLKNYKKYGEIYRPVVDNSGKNNPMYGRTNEKNPNSKKVVVIKNKKSHIFNSCSEAEIKFNVTGLRNYARGVCNHYYRKQDIYIYYLNDKAIADTLEEILEIEKSISEVK